MHTAHCTRIPATGTMDRDVDLSRRSRRFLGVASLLTVLAMAGCAANDSRPLTSIEQFSSTDGADRYDSYWEAAQEALRRNRFRIDRVDRTAGILTSFPVLSQNFIEFWRHDVNSRKDLIESTINPIRRRVEVRFQTSDGGVLESMEVVVRKERLSAPDRQFNSTAAAYRLFGETLPTTTGQSARGSGITWLDYGRDENLEDYLRLAILGIVTEPEDV
ncbi:MAG: hypothetical protein ACPGXK_10790 [Phycisphaerae bacterium]